MDQRHLMTELPNRDRRSHRLRQDIRSAVLNLILSGALKPGEALNESRLAAQLKVSRTPLREALLQLEREGFIRSDKRRGFSVEHLAARDVREMYPLIWTLEGLAIRSNAICAHLLVPDLVRINSEFAKARNPERALALDTEWHEHLISQSQNRRLLQTLSALRLGVRRYETVYMLSISLVPESVRHHDKVIEALKRHDVEASVAALEENWRFGMEVLVRKMGEE
jgi:DNA-binding GntR family transcriptional regulator